MKKNVKGISLVLAASMGLALLGGCSKKSEVNQNEMIEKYAKCCTLGDYAGVEYEAHITEVTDEVINAEINNLLLNYATAEEVADAIAENGDKVNIDFDGSIDGVAFEGGSTQGMGYDLTLGSGGMIDGFEDQIVGHKSGETFDIEVTFPEDYGKDDLNGRDAVFKITINKVYKMKLPEYNNEFVTSYTNYKTTAELEDAIRENYATNDKNLNKQAIIEQVMKVANITEYPQKDVQALIDETVSKVEEEAKGYGYDAETYVKVLYGVSSMDEFKTYISGLAEDFIREKIVICAVAKAENITATDDEIKAYKQIMMDKLGMTEEELGEVYTNEDIVYYTIADKVYEVLLEKATPINK